jgi:hypothetical protein
MLEEDFDGELFADDINSALEDKTKRLDSFTSLGDTSYTIHSETYHNIYGNVIDIELSYNNDISDQVLIMEFQFNTKCPDFEYEMFTLNDYNPSEAVDFMIELYDDLLDRIYKDNKNNLHKFSKADMKHMLKKHPNDEFIRSAVSGSKYKLFDQFINEDRGEGEFSERFTDQVSEELDDFFMDNIHNYTGNWYVINSDQYEELFDENLYVKMSLTEDGNEVEISFDANARDDIKETVPAEPFYVANALNEMFKKWLVIVFKEDNNLILKMGDAALKVIEDAFPDKDIQELIRSVRGGKKYKIFDSFLSDEKEPGKPELPIGAYKEGEKDEEGTPLYDDAHNFVDAIQGELGFNFGFLKPVSKSFYTITFMIEDLVTKKPIYIETEIINPGEESRLIKLEFDTRNEDKYPTEDTRPEEDLPGIADLLKKYLMEHYTEHMENDTEISQTEIAKLKMLVSLFPNYDKAKNLLKSLEGGKKYKVLDFYSYVNESFNKPTSRKEKKAEEESDIDEEGPIMKGLISYFDNELDIILEEAKMDSSETYDIFVREKDDIVIIKIGVASSAWKEDGLKEKAVKLRKIADSYDALIEVMKKYPEYTYYIEGHGVRRTYRMVFKVKLSDLMKIEKIKNLIDSHKGGGKYKLFMQTDEEV